MEELHKAFFISKGATLTTVLNGAQLCSDNCSVISFRVRQPNVGGNREVDPVNGFQIFHIVAVAVESPCSTAASEYTGHCIGVSHTALTRLVNRKIYSAGAGAPQLGNREILFHPLSCQTKQSHSKTSHFVFSAIFKMAAKHDSITKQSYILNYVFFLMTRLRVDLNSMCILSFIISFEAMASHSETNHLVL